MREWGLPLFAVAMLIIASVTLRSYNERPSALEPMPDVSIKCTTEPAAPIEEEGTERVGVLWAQVEQQPLCPTARQRFVKRVRSLYRLHLHETRCV